MTNMKSEFIRARMEANTKKEAEAVLAELGLSPTEAITLFYRQLVLRRGLPFEVRIPNAETIGAIEESRDDLQPMTVDALEQELTAIADEVRSEN